MFNFRQARPEDKQPLLRMLAKAKDVPVLWRNKYVINHYLDEVHVVVYRGQLVGMVHLCTFTSGEGWLESAYILPAFRGKGIGSKFAAYQIAIARRKGVRFLRLATGWKNKRVQHVMSDKLQFNTQVPWYRVKLKLLSDIKATGRAVRYCQVQHVDEYWSFVQKNNEFNRSKRLITSLEDSYIWYTLEYLTLKYIVMQGKSLASYTNGRITALMLIVDKPRSQKGNLLVLQVYPNSVEDYAALLSFQLRQKPSLWLSVSSSPVKALNYMNLAKEVVTIRSNKWVVLEKRL